MLLSGSELHHGVRPRVEDDPRPAVPRKGRRGSYSSSLVER